MNYLILFSWLLIAVTVFSQEEEERYGTNELTIQVTNVSNKSILFELSPLGTVFCNDGNCNFETCEVPTYNSTLTTQGEITDVLCEHNGFRVRFCDEDDDTEVVGCAQETAGLKTLKWGFYKMTVKENGNEKGYCYFDWRDTGFPKGEYCNFACNDNDMTIRYDGSGDIIFFNKPNPSKNDPDGETLASGDIIIWAEWKDCEERDCLWFWENGLVIDDSGNNPRVVWTPHPTFQATSYKVYRTVSQTPLTKPALYASVIATVNSSIYEYTDGDISLTTNGNYVYYFVEGYNGSYSGASNIGLVRGYFYKENIYSKDNAQIKFNLNQNYPNPFNPSTMIKYQIPEDGFVTLKVYDVLGKEIKTIINEQKLAGEYEVKFDAVDLAGGVYIYRITALRDGKILFSQSKQMILLK